MEEFTKNFPIAFGLCLFTGLTTVIGAALAFFVRRDSSRPLALGLSFSAGVMLYVSFTEILTKAHDQLAQTHGNINAHWLTLAGFFGGIVVIALIDRLLPAATNPHEPRASRDIEELKPHESGWKSPGDPVALAKRRALLRMGLFSALAITLHNFPEGLATFISALEDPRIGIAIAIGMALHNIPEGVSVSVPIYYATGSRKKPFFLASLSGLAEPVGALIGFFILAPFLTPAVMGVTFAAVAGIMVFISLDELLPTARAHAKGHETIYGIIAGMAVMGASLVLLK